LRLIRRFEERVVQLVAANEISGVTHEYIGQEAVATGVCAALRADDKLTSTHRGHGHLLARGASPAGMMAELMGRITGLNRGRGGSMHIADFSLGILGANGIVAAGAPMAAGAAWAAKMRGRDSVAVAFFGDGGVNQGVLHEAMNLAAIWNLPVIFCCENNGYAVTLPAARSSRLPIAERVGGYGMPVLSADGMDPEDVYRTAATAVSTARSGGGPSFLECRTYRYVGHHTAEASMKLNYRSAEEMERWRHLDPLVNWPIRLEAEGLLSSDGRRKIDEEVENTLDEAVEFARRSPEPAPEEALDFAYAGATNARFPARGWREN
jgi:pyruvate dehydrogenase E1 component alpha subunit